MVRKINMTPSVGDQLGAILSQARKSAGAPSGTVVTHNADGTKTISGPGAGAAGVALWVGDTTPPGKPAGLSASSKNGVVIVTWDGSLDGGRPEDFGKITVAATVGAGTPRVVGELVEKGSLVIDGLTPGDSVTVSATASDLARDESGELTPNVSGATTLPPVTVTSVVDQAEIDAMNQTLSEAAAELAQAQMDITTAQSGAQSALDQLAGTSPSTLGDRTAQAASKAETAQSTAAGAEQAAADARAAAQAADAAATSRSAAAEQAAKEYAAQQAQLEAAQAKADALSAAAVDAQAKADAAQAAAAADATAKADAAKVAADAAAQAKADAAKQAAVTAAAADASSKANTARDTAKAYADTLNSAQSQALAAFTDQVTGDIATLQAQVDSQIETWYMGGVPTLSNAPADAWTTVDERARHEGDLYYDRATGFSYRFLNDGGYKWVRLADSDVTKALAAAAEAQDTADSKRRVFTAQPVPPYDPGDLWTAGPSGDLMRCKTARASGSYVAADWEKASKYTDDSVATAARAAADAAQAAADAALSASQDFIKDPQFVTGADNVKQVTINASDSNAGKLPGTATTYGKVTGYDSWTLNTLITTVPGHVYELSVWAKVASDNTQTGNGFGLMVWRLTADGNTVQGYAGNGWPDGATTLADWKQIKWRWTAPSDGSWPFVRPALRAGGYQALFLVTDWHVRDVTDVVALEQAAATAKAAADAADAKAVAAQQTATDAKTTAGTALTQAQTAKTTADGKNKIIPGTTQPATTGLVAGDLWFQLNSSGNVVGIKVFNGSAFVDYVLLASQILVAGSVGTIQLANGAVNADKVTASVALLNKILVRKLVGDDIAADTVTANNLLANEAMLAKLLVRKLKADELEVGQIAAAIISSGSFRATDGSGNVTVSIDGATGKLTAVSAELIDANITGTLRTGATGNRVEMSSETSTSGGVTTTIGSQRFYTSTGDTNPGRVQASSSLTLPNGDTVSQDARTLLVQSGAADATTAPAALTLSTAKRTSGGDTYRRSYAGVQGNSFFTASPDATGVQYVVTDRLGGGTVSNPGLHDFVGAPGARAVIAGAADPTENGEYVWAGSGWVPAHGVVTLSRTTEQPSGPGDVEMIYNTVSQNTGGFTVANTSTYSSVTIPVDGVYRIHLHGFRNSAGQIESNIGINEDESLINNVWWAPMQGAAYAVLHATFAVSLKKGDVIKHRLRGMTNSATITQTNTMTIEH